MSAAEQRQAVSDLAQLAIDDLRALLTLLREASPSQIRDALVEALADIGETYGSAAAALAADWFDDLRDQADVKGRFSAIAATSPTRERWESLARWGTVPLFGTQPEPEKAFMRISGGLQRSVADQHRLTIVESSIRDPRAKGWTRVGVGGSCGFCRMLIDRGHVYTDSSVTFRSHDHCNCAASPRWDDRVSKASPEAYQQSQRRRSAETRRADNERAYAFIADKYGDT